MALVCADKYVTGGGPQAAEKARVLLKLIQFIGAVSGGKTVTQVALNYLMCKGKRDSSTLYAIELLLRCCNPASPSDVDFLQTQTTLDPGLHLRSWLHPAGLDKTNVHATP